MNDENIFGFISDRDVVFFDLETTGIDVKTDRIVEISAKKYTRERTIEEIHYYLNPTIKVAEEAYLVHGLSDEFLSNHPTFCEKSTELFEFFKGCDLGGYNVVKYDIPILFEEFTRCEIFLNIFKINVIDVYNLLNKYETRKLGDVYKRFFNKEMENAHTTQGDVDATVSILNAQIDKYELTDKSASYISNKVRSNDKNEKFLDYDSWFLYRDGEVFYNKGEFRGHKVNEHTEYLMWIYQNGKFQNNVRYVAKELLKKYTNNE